MDSVISALAERLKASYGLDITRGESEMLVSIALPGGRRQIVKVMTVSSPVDGYYSFVLRFQSRACTARNAIMVAGALERNAGPHIYGLGLDTSVQPEAIDVLYHCVIDPADVTVVYNAIVHVATRADYIEQKTGGDDVF